MIRKQEMGKEKKRKTLSQEFTLLTVTTSVGTLFLLGIVLIGVFSFVCRTRVLDTRTPEQAHSVYFRRRSLYPP